MTTIIPYNTYYEIDQSYMQMLGFNRNVTENPLKPMYILKPTYLKHNHAQSPAVAFIPIGHICA